MEGDTRGGSEADPSRPVEDHVDDAHVQDSPRLTSTVEVTVSEAVDLRVERDSNAVCNTAVEIQEREREGEGQVDRVTTLQTTNIGQYPCDMLW